MLQLAPPRRNPLILAKSYSGCLFCAGIGTLSFTDMFSGAGGSSLGLELVCCPMCGRQLIEVTQALNHWDLAVEAHNHNFPNADHDRHDVDDVHPRRFRRTNGLWASPECVNHTACKGTRDDSPEAQRSRATFKDIVRFTAYHKYEVVLVENVIEARLWCEHPKCGCGKEFDAFWKAMLDEGYEGKILYLNSQFFDGTAQSRDRMYAFFWRVGLPEPDLDCSPPSWCTECLEIVDGVRHWKPASRGSVRESIFEWGRYGAQYDFRCPNAGCNQPVAPAVMGAHSILDSTIPIERIGDRRYANGKPKVLKPNTRKRILTGVQNLGRNQPIAVQVGGHLYERKGYARVWSVDSPLPTVTTTRTTALVTPAGGQDAAARTVDKPMHTVIGNDRLALVVQNMEHNVARDVGQPAPTVTTGGNQMLVQLNRGPKSPNDTRGGGRSVNEPLRTISGHGELGLVHYRGEHGTVRPGGIPAHTLTAGGRHHGLLVYHGTPGWVRPVDQPAGVVTGKDHHALLVPYNRTGVARSIHQPTGTLTTRDREALVVTEADIDDMHFRMLHWTELLRAQRMDVLPNGNPYELTARRKNKRGKYVDLTQEHRVKMIGNAVSSPVSTALGYVVVEILR